MDELTQECARDLLETVPVVMRFIRNQVRLRRTAGVALPQFRTLSFLRRGGEAYLSTVAENLGNSLIELILISSTIEFVWAETDSLSLDKF